MHSLMADLAKKYRVCLRQVKAAVQYLQGISDFKIKCLRSDTH